MTAARVLLLRHPSVSARFAGRCYGRTDAGLSDEGIAAAHAIAAALAGQTFTCVAASPSRRARFLGGRIAAQLGVPWHIDHRLAERCFGAWEGRPWDEIWAREGDAMNGMIDAPDLYRPGGGETTSELASRVLEWFVALPTGTAVVAATHGGPIAALVGRLKAEAPRRWLHHVPAPGTGWLIEPGRNGWRITPQRPEARAYAISGEAQAGSFQPATPVLSRPAFRHGRRRRS